MSILVQFMYINVKSVARVHVYMHHTIQDETHHTPYKAFTQIIYVYKTYTHSIM